MLQAHGLAQIRQRIAQGEGAHTEFKRTLEFRLVGRSICAFGNRGGGVLTLPLRRWPLRLGLQLATGLVFNLVG